MFSDSKLVNCSGKTTISRVTGKSATTFDRLAGQAGPRFTRLETDDPGPVRLRRPGYRLA